MEDTYPQEFTQLSKENAEALVVATKGIGPEVNADKTKYMVMSIDSSSIERVEDFKCLGTMLTKQNFIQ
jgi:hypothetical protein